MYLKGSRYLKAVFVAGLVGCAPVPHAPLLPEQRPLGKDTQAYVAPRDPSRAAAAKVRGKEPSGVISLSEALAAALLRNPELSAFSWEVRAAEARALQAGLFPNPELEVEVEEFGGEGERSGFDGAEAAFGLSQLVELGGKRWKRAKAAQLEGSLAAWDYEAKRLDVLTDTTKAFVEVLFAQEQVALREELLRLAERVLTSVAQRVRAGKVSPLEENKAKVALSTGRIKLTKARHELEAARKRLAAAWGSISPTFEKVEGQAAEIRAIPAVERLTHLASQNPDMARWAVEVEQRRAALALEESKRIPDLTVSGGVRRFNETEDNAFVVGFSIPLPLFDRNQGGIREARHILAKAQAERSAAEVRVRTALAEAYEALAFAYAESMALKNELLPAAQAAFDAATEGYRQGKFSYLDVLDAQRTLFEARAQHIEALAAYHKGVSDVERLIGQSLSTVDSN